jgi:hypothetical protein
LDDEGEGVRASQCRKNAAGKMQSLLASGETFAQQPGASEAILVDCLRRAGLSSEALQVIDEASTQSFDDTILKVLALERELVKRGDRSAHLIKEALGD